MFILFGLISYALYIYLLINTSSSLKYKKLRPSHVFAYSICLFCFPGFFLFYKEYENKIYGLGTFVLYPNDLGFCLSVVYISAMLVPWVSRALINETTNNIKDKYLGTFFFMISGLVILFWILNPLRLTYLYDLFESLKSGSGAESQFLRRNIYNDGFYNTKVFSWCRYSIITFLILVFLNNLHIRFSRFACLISGFVLFFLAVASFHKSSWLLSLLFPFFLFFLDVSREGFRVSRWAFFAPFVFLPFCILFGYLLQYRELGFDIFELQTKVAFERLFCASTSGLLAFTSEFKFEHMNFEDVFYPSRNLENTPEAIVGMLLGKQTTIQAGVLGSLYCSLGVKGIIIFPLFLFAFILLADFCYVKSFLMGNKSLACCFLFPPVMIMHNPLYPSIFSSGFFVLLLIFCLVYFFNRRLL